MTQLATRAYRKDPIAAPPFPLYYVGPEIVDFSQSNLLALFTAQMAANTDGITLTLTARTNEYMYVLSSEAGGLITFQDTSGSPASGSWDGATWSGDTPATTRGPRTVSLDFGNGGAIYNLYRTDFSNLGTKTWKLTFNRNQYA